MRNRGTVCMLLLFAPAALAPSALRSADAKPHFRVLNNTASLPGHPCQPAHLKAVAARLAMLGSLVRGEWWGDDQYYSLIFAPSKDDRRRYLVTLSKDYTRVTDVREANDGPNGNYIDQGGCSNEGDFRKKRLSLVEKGLGVRTLPVTLAPRPRVAAAPTWTIAKSETIYPPGRQPREPGPAPVASDRQYDLVCSGSGKTRAINRYGDFADPRQSYESFRYRVDLATARVCRDECSSIGTIDEFAESLVVHLVPAELNTINRRSGAYRRSFRINDQAGTTTGSCTKAPFTPFPLPPARKF